MDVTAASSPVPAAVGLQRRRGRGAGALAAAGALFLAYPLLRPYTDETTLEGAAAMAGPAWLVSHLCAMVAFVLLSLGLWRRSSSSAAVAAAAGTALVLPYYGAETFGLRTIGARAAADGDPSLLGLADQLRTQPVAMTMFGLGLVCLAVAGALLARSLWQDGAVARGGAVLAGAGLVLYLPQFFAPGPLRIGHGVLLAGGLVAVAVTPARRR